MRSKFTTLLTVIGAVTVLVLAANTVALAATGQSFLLGKSNTANRVTTLSRTTNGSVLSLHSKSSSSAPLQVNGHGKVTNLNADLLDGLHATALENKAFVYTVPTEVAVSVFSINFPGLPSGIYQASFDVVTSISAATPVNCEFIYSDTGSALLNYGSVNSTFSTVNGGGIVDTRGRTIKLRCFTFNGTFSTHAPAAQVSFTQVNLASIAATTNARVVAVHPARVDASH